MRRQTRHRGPKPLYTAVTEEVEVNDDNMTDEKRDIQKLLARPYKYGFKTIIESDTFPKVCRGCCRRPGCH